MSKLVYGVGINDADYSVTKFVKNKKGNISSSITCDFYSRWVAMISRCYSSSSLKLRPSYVGCYVCDDWLTFSNFKAWMEKQDWKGKCLDKDVINFGNKEYSPEFCAFIDMSTNSFVTSCAKSRGKLMIGVTWHREMSMFKATCSNPFTHKNEYLGLFMSEISAHEAWRKRKHDLACQLADLQTDVRASNALRLRYA